MRIVAVIPARMGSSRFPGKPLAPILGMPMVEHVRRRVMMCPGLDGVYVATPDDDIYRCTERYGGKAIMTSHEHQRASDRVAEAARHITADLYVLVQGDEPMIDPSMVMQATRFDFETAGCTNLAAPILTEEERNNPNTIKVPVDCQSHAMYFTRQAVPSQYKQVCVIGFKATSLAMYGSLEATPLEQAESIDMLRFLEHGFRVKMLPTAFGTQSVDTPGELVKVEGMMKNDSLTCQYMT